MNIKSIGIVIADRCEYEPLRDRALEMGGNESFIGGMECVRFECAGFNIIAVLCGIGKVNAASAAAFLITEGAELLISTGYSGGIAGAPRGSTAIATRYLEHDFDLTPLGYEMAVKPDQQYIYDADLALNEVALKAYPGLVSGVMVSGDCFVCSDELRDRLRDSYGAVACDMESAAVASVGFKCNINTFAIRRISDNAGNDASGMYQAAAVYDSSMTDMLINIIKRFGEDK